MFFCAIYCTISQLNNIGSVISLILWDCRIKASATRNELFANDLTIQNWIFT